ncbi:MAG TPA: amidophosphoribosyltransferase [Acidimicrobiales bacterium]|nr:amidophosphoribosyltransferase [Acidimicrobiales bacterium]
MPVHADPGPAPVDHDDDDKPKEACGVFGVYAPNQPVAHLTYDGLYALQHRGQESAGMAVSDGDLIMVDKDMGLVTNVFNDYKLAALPGYLAIGHTRYSTTGSSCYSAAQPVHRSAGLEDSPHSFALAHNGNLTNTEALAEEAGMLPGMIASDSELIAELVARAYSTVPRSDERELELALMATLPRLEGAFSLTIMDEAHLIGVRDPNGFRPLCLGKLDSGWVLASETPALDVIGAHFVREIEPGEMVVIDASGIREYRPFAPERINPKLCLFEFVYFARPDSVLYGREVHGARQRMGEALAAQAHVDADIVIGVPETALAAAEGYARAAGIPYGQGLIKNRYIGRTFISPSQVQRDHGVRRKLNPLKENIAGKRVVVVDDSIVRGTTSRAIVRMLRDAGASEVHFRVMSPPYRWPCFYGMDTGSRAELLAANMTIGEIQDYLAVDSLAYLTIENLERAVGAPNAGFCNACLTGDYPVTVSPTLHKGVLEGNDMPAPDLV